MFSACIVSGFVWFSLMACCLLSNVRNHIEWRLICWLRPEHRASTMNSITCFLEIYYDNITSYHCDASPDGGCMYVCMWSALKSFAWGSVKNCLKLASLYSNTWLFVICFVTQWYLDDKRHDVTKWCVTDTVHLFASLPRRCTKY